MLHRSAYQQKRWTSSKLYKMAKVIALSASLSSDHVSIQVGKKSHSKIFLEHTLVLCTRSKFFENSLTGNTETSEEAQKTTLMFEDVTPDVFEILLR